MSTYWHFECQDHDPSLLSEEFTQHADDQHFAHGVALALARPLPEEGPDFHDASRAYFDRNARSFLRGHPKCTLGLVSEYGDRRELTPSYTHEPEGTESEPAQLASAVTAERDELQAELYRHEYDGDNKCTCGDSCSGTTDGSCWTIETNRHLADVLIAKGYRREPEPQEGEWCVYESATGVPYAVTPPTERECRAEAAIAGVGHDAVPLALAVLFRNAFAHGRMYGRQQAREQAVTPSTEETP